MGGTHSIVTTHEERMEAQIQDLYEQIRSLTERVHKLEAAPTPEYVRAQIDEMRFDG